MNATTCKRTDLTYQRARMLAEHLVSQLAPLCEPDKCVVVGSVRRQEAYPGDVEILCIPKTGSVRTPGELLPCEQNLVMHYIDVQRRAHKGLKLIKGGARYQQITIGSIQVDIFMTNAEQWGRMVAIRTGPASFSKKLASLWTMQGYKAQNGRLVPIDDWKLIPSFPTEQDFFNFLGIDFIEPEKRQ